MRLRNIFRAVVSLAAVGIGIAWALPATALGIAGGLSLVMIGGGIALRAANWTVRTMLQPGASEAERSEPLMPPGAGTVWITLVSAACIAVAYETEHGAFHDPHGYAFFPMMLPWLLLTIAPIYGPLVHERLRRDDLLPDFDL